MYLVLAAFIASKDKNKKEISENDFLTLNKIDKNIFPNILKNKFKEKDLIYEEIDYFNGIPNERIVWKFWNLADTSFAKTIWKLNLEKVLTNKKIYVEPKLSFFFDYFEDSKFSKNFKISKEKPKKLDFSHFKNIFVKNEKKISIRLLFNRKINFNLISEEIKFKFKKIIIHTHGGGFIASSSSYH